MEKESKVVELVCMITIFYDSAAAGPAGRRQ